MANLSLNSITTKGRVPTHGMNQVGKTSEETFKSIEGDFGADVANKYRELTETDNSGDDLLSKALDEIYVDHVKRGDVSSDIPFNSDQD